MLSANAFRHQIVMPEQQKVYDYWRSKCQGGAFPSRFDILPEDIVTALPMTSLIDFRSDSQNPRFRYRLAGTGFWNLYEQEIQGRYLDELPIGDRLAYWNRVLGQVLLNRRPYAGVTRTGTPNGGHLAQFWLRLPLSADGKTINMIMGFDHLVKLSSIEKDFSQVEKMTA